MTDHKPGTMQVDTDLVRQLAELLDATSLTEIEVQDGERRIKVARKVQAAPAMAHMPAPPASAPAATAAVTHAPVPPQVDNSNAIRSPMVGTVYLAAEPAAANFVSVGDKIDAGATLLIIEAMKVMNPIIAPHGGTVRAVLVANGSPVEFDQPLVVIE
jgi:acetyl-CoA carboxylase biotin carboxyl carrier protein